MSTRRRAAPLVALLLVSSIPPIAAQDLRLAPAPAPPPPPPPLSIYYPPTVLIAPFGGIVWSSQPGLPSPLIFREEGGEATASGFGWEAGVEVVVWLSDAIPMRLLPRASFQHRSGDATERAMGIARLASGDPAAPDTGEVSVALDYDSELSFDMLAIGALVDVVVVRGRRTSLSAVLGPTAYFVLDADLRQRVALVDEENNRFINDLGLPTENEGSALVLFHERPPGARSFGMGLSAGVRLRIEHSDNAHLWFGLQGEAMLGALVDHMDVPVAISLTAGLEVPIAWEGDY